MYFHRFLRRFGLNSVILKLSNAANSARSVDIAHMKKGAPNFITCIGPDGKEKHTLRRAILPDPQRCSGRYQRFLRGRSGQQAMGQREPDGAKGILGKRGQLVANMGRGRKTWPHRQKCEDVETGLLLVE